MLTDRKINGLIICCVNSNIEDRDTVFASIQLQDESAADDTSDGVVIEEDSNEVVIYEEDEDDDNLAGMQFVTEKIVTEQVISNKSNTVDSTCKYFGLCRGATSIKANFRSENFCYKYSDLQFLCDS